MDIQLKMSLKLLFSYYFLGIDMGLVFKIHVEKFVKFEFNHLF